MNARKPYATDVKGEEWEFIARASSQSKGAVATYVKAAEQAQLQWGAIAALDDRALAERLAPLPAQAFELARWKKARVSIDYHIDIDRHYYRVSHQLVGRDVEVRIAAGTIERVHEGKRVASHVNAARRTANGRRGGCWPGANRLAPKRTRW